MGVVDYLSNLLLDIIKSQYQQKIDEKKLKQALEEYITRQHKYNNRYSSSEELDWQALIDYISNNLVEVAVTRVFDPNKSSRDKARHEIVDRVVAAVNVESVESKRLVARFTYDSLDIIRDFYKQSLNINDYILADLVVDGVAEELRSIERNVKRHIDESQSLFSLDKANELSSNNQIGVIGEGIKTMLHTASKNHPCFPYYGYDYKDGITISKPLRDDATRKYPPRLQITANAMLGNTNNNGDPFDYSYRHQIPIQMEVTEATKLLGDSLDPNQREAEELIGNTITMYPPEFPPQFPCSIKVGDDTYFDYILLRTQKINDNGEYVVGNQEQGGDIYFEICVDPKNEKINRFNFRINYNANRGLLKLARFRQALSQNNDLHIYRLSEGKDFLAGHVSKTTINPAFETIDNEVDFLERVCNIEDYYKVVLNLNQEISREDFNTIYYLSELIRNTEVRGTWDEELIIDEVTENMRDEFLSMKDVAYSARYTFVGTMDLLGAEIAFKVQRTMNEVVIADFDKLIKRTEVLDVGDEIKIRLKAGKDNSAIDTIYFSED